MTDEQTTERRERIARVLRESLYPNLPDDTPLGDGWLRHADAAIAAYESLEPEYEYVKIAGGWFNEERQTLFSKFTAVRPEWKAVYYRRVVPPQEAEGTCPTCDGNGWVWTISNITGSGGNANRTAPCPNLAFHSSPNPEGANDGG